MNKEGKKDGFFYNSQKPSDSLYPAKISFEKIFEI